MLKAIYTANFNNYDLFREPNVITPGWKYYYYTNDRSIKSDTWQVVYVDPADNKQARKIKITNPFKHYDTSIWVDASITINCDLDRFIKKYCGNSFLSLMSHPHRYCVYDEAKECIKRQKDDPEVISKQVELYKSLGYPAKSGMVATGIIVRKRNSVVDEFCNLWWKEVETHSKRDQLSFNFVHFHTPIPYHLFPFDVLKREFILNKHSK